MKKTLFAIQALVVGLGLSYSQADAVTSNGYTIITFGDIDQDWADFRIDHDSVNAPQSGLLGTTGIAYTVSDRNNDTTGILRSHSNVVNVDEKWNEAALLSMNTDMGTSLTTSVLGTAKIIASSTRNSEFSLSLNSQAGKGASSFAAGSALTLYVGVSATNGSLAGAYNVSGLKDVTMSYAAADGSGFASEVSYTPSAATNKTLSIVKIEGTVQDASDVQFWASNVGNNKAGMVFAAYKATQAPEPATAPLSLLALAGLATRRRRK